MELKIKEGSLLARVARLVLKSPNVAMVLGKTIHLSGVSRDAFLQNKPWVAHELCHVRQFRHYGFVENDKNLNLIRSAISDRYAGVAKSYL